MRKPLCESKDPQMRDVNMTPLIDVSLVLVVILLLATPLAFESSIGVRQSQATGRAAERDDEQRRIELTVLDDETVRVNTDTLPVSEMGARIAEALSEGPDPLVVVRCEAGVSHGGFVRVLDEAKSQGAERIAVVSPGGSGS